MMCSVCLPHHRFQAPRHCRIPLCNSWEVKRTVLLKILSLSFGMIKESLLIISDLCVGFGTNPLCSSLPNKWCSYVMVLFIIMPMSRSLVLSKLNLGLMDGRPALSFWLTLMGLDSTERGRPPTPFGVHCCLVQVNLVHFLTEKF